MSTSRETIFGKKSRLGVFAALLSIALMIPAYGNCAEKILTSYTWDRELGVAVSDEAAMPDDNWGPWSAPGGSVRNVLNTSGFGNRVGGETYWDSRCDWNEATITDMAPQILGKSE